LIDDITTQPFAYDPFAAHIQEDPYPYYRVLRDTYPAYYNEHRGFWTLSRFGDVQAAARDWKRYSNLNGVELDATQDFYPDTFGPGILINTDPPQHERIRKVVHAAFTPRQIQTLEERVRTTVLQLLDALSEQAKPDLAEDFAWRLPVSTLGYLLGFPEEDHAYLERVMYDFEARQSEPDEVDHFDLPAVAQEAGAELARYIADAVAERRKRPKDDLLSVLVEAEMAGTLDPDESRGLTFILVMAGIDTTACLLSNTFHRLEKRHDDRRRLVADPLLIPAAVEEMIRYEAPVQGLARVAATDTTLHGQTIPAGAAVWLAYAAANRDERRFPNPDNLDLFREQRRHLGFGEGIHHCIGAPLARLEARVALQEFFTRFDEYEIVAPSERLHQHTTRGWSHLSAVLSQSGTVPRSTGGGSP
jgi:cytochrome P450